MAGYNVSFIYRIIDKYSKPLRRIAQQTTGFQKTVGKVGFGLGKRLGQSVRGLDSLGKKLRGIPSLANAAASGFAFMAASIPINRAMDFESAVTRLDKVLEFPSLSARSDFVKGLRTIGPAMGITATEMADLAFQAARLGVASEDILQFSQQAARTSIALDDLSIQEAGELIGDLKVKFGLAAEGVDVMLDSVNRLSDKTSASGADILNVTQRMASQFSALKIPPEIGTALAATARQFEVRADRAATGLKIFFNKLVEMGHEADLIADPLGTIKNVLSDIQKLPEGQRGTAVTDMFGVESQSVVLGLVDKMGVLKDNIRLVTDETTRAGSSQREFNKVMGTARAKVAVAKAKFDALMTVLGEKLLPVIGRLADAAGPMIDKMIEFVDQNPGIVKIAAGIGLVVAAFVPLAGIIGAALIVFNPLGLAISAIVVGLGAAAAAVTVWWDEFKAFGSWINDVLGGIFDKVWSKLEGLGGVISGALGFFGVGVEESITDKPVDEYKSPATEQAVANSQATLSGNIGIAVTGPGKVTEAGIKSDPPGNLGLNVAGAR